MTYREAKKLHNGDEVIIKKTSEVVTVIENHIFAKRTELLCNNGNIYYHNEVK